MKKNNLNLLIFTLFVFLIGCQQDVPVLDNSVSVPDYSKIYVNGLSGSDSSGDGSGSSPFKTISYALSSAVYGNTVCVISLPNSNSYTIASTLNVPSGVNLYGGYNSSLDRDIDNNKTIINGSSTVLYYSEVNIDAEISGFEINGSSVLGSGDGAFGIRINSGSAVLTIKNNNITSGDVSIVSGSSYGIYAKNLAGLNIEENTITSGNGGPGVSGIDGTSGSNGSDGRSGGNGDPDDQDRPGSGGAGGNPGGGAAGGGGYSSHWDGYDGVGLQGGSGGIEGHPGLAGSDGASGSNGADGDNGSGGETFGSVSDLYTVSSGIDGTDGSNGQPGSGGGGGGAEHGTFADDGAGNGGGGGGGYGAGGTAGTGGTGGGGSFSIFLVDVGNAVVRENIISSSNGGDGGNSGIGGPGGSGGNGGSGSAYATTEIGAGGNGGSGGDGGNGGSGGGGGGGPSIGIFYGSSTSNINGNTIVTGNGGTGGTGANSGAQGLEVDTYQF